MQPLSLYNFPAYASAPAASVVQGGGLGLPQASLDSAGSAGSAQLAQSISTQQAPMLGIMQMMLQMMQAMMQLLLGGQAQPQQAPAGLPAQQAASPFGAAVPGVPGQAGSASPTGTVAGIPTQFGPMGITGVPTGIPAQGVAGAVGAGNAGTAQIAPNDLVDFVLAGSRGGTAGTDEGIFGAFARPGSRLSTAGENEFDAVIAKSYAAQFKAYALGLPAAFIPGQTSVEQVANNIAIGQQTPMTQEAELLSQVAATYRGDFGGRSTYNNPVLKQLLVSWGRTDIANQPLVGQTDVQSIGGVVKALNEERDPAKRQAWLQQIFDFQGNTPVSPSGAVPNAPQYQTAINMVRSGALDQLVNNFNNGIRTSGPVQIPPTTAAAGGAGAAGGVAGGAGGTAANVAGGAGGAAGGVGVPAAGSAATPDVNKNVNFGSLSTQERSQIGLNDRDRAILHLWGRQVISRGVQDGGIYSNIIDQNGNGISGTAAEQQLVRELRAQDQAQFGGDTGKALDREFFALQQRINPNTDPAKIQQYLNAPVRFSQGPVNITSDVATLERQAGLSKFDQAALRLWGHEPLFNSGKIDGSILAYTIGNANSLDSAGRVNSQGQLSQTGSNIDDDARVLLEADLASDGIRNGDSLESAFGSVLDKIYLGGPGASAQQTQQVAQQRAVANGRSIQQITQDVQQGMGQALADAANMVKNHPVMSAAAVGGMAAATAVCPFLGGMAVGGAGIAAGQAFLNRNTQAAGNAGGAGASGYQ